MYGSRLVPLPDRVRSAEVASRPALDQGDWAQFVNYTIEQNISSATAQALADDYATRLYASGGRGLTPDDFSDLRSKYAGRLSPDAMNHLQTWIEDIYAKARARQ